MEEWVAGSSDNRQYRIRLGGVLDPRWTAWFEGVAMTYEAGDTIVLTGRVDQAELYGIIARLRNLGVTLVSIVREP